MMFDVVETTCNFCGRKTSEKILANRLIRHLPESRLFGGQLRIVQCRSCGLRYLNPRPATEILPLIYDYDCYLDSTNTNEVLQEYFFSLISNSHPHAHRVLEVGCGTGEFLSYLERRGINVAGVEFADASKRVKFKGDLYVGMIEDISLPQGQFDVALLLNVIEHLVDPLKTLEKIRGALLRDGLLILRHPNSDLFHNRIYKSIIEIPKYLLHQVIRFFGGTAGYTIVGFQNQHLFYFNRDSIERILRKSGFSIKYFTTNDPFNRYRMTERFGQLRFVESLIALTRYVMGWFGLGAECIIVATRSPN